MGGKRLAPTRRVAAKQAGLWWQFVMSAITRHLDKTRNVVISWVMKTTQDIARALAALGHEARLGTFRLLVKAGEEGLRVGEIGAHLGMAPSTLAHHLSALVDAGLVQQERLGREVVNRADYPAMNELLGFLSAECCTGVTLQSDEDAA